MPSTDTARRINNVGEKTMRNEQINAAYADYKELADDRTITALFAAIRKHAEAVARSYRVTDPEDVGSALVVHVWERLVKFDGRSTFSTWLHRVTQNFMKDHYRRTKNERFILGDDALATIAGPEFHPSRDPENLSELSPLLRETVVAVLTTHSYKDAAKELCISRQTLKSRIMHVRQIMQI